MSGPAADTSPGGKGWKSVAGVVTGAGFAPGDGNAGARQPRGAMIMKSVSIFLASGRRASSAVRNRQSTDEGNSVNTVKKKPRARKPKMEDGANAGKISAKLMETLKKKTHFTRQEIEALVRIYRKLVANNHVAARAALMASSAIGLAKPMPLVEGVDRTVFRELLHSTFDLVTEDTLMERIFCAWDKGQEGSLKLEGWLSGLSVFLRGTPQEQTEFCFRVYDLNADGFITRDEMFQLLKNCLIKQPQDEDPDEGVRDLVELALRKLDYDHDGKVSFEDYLQAVTDEPLLLEAFGQCLPTDGASASFISTLQS